MSLLPRLFLAGLVALISCSGAGRIDRANLPSCVTCARISGEIDLVFIRQVCMPSFRSPNVEAADRFYAYSGLWTTRDEALREAEEKIQRQVRALNPRLPLDQLGQYQVSTIVACDPAQFQAFLKVSIPKDLQGSSLAPGGYRHPEEAGRDRK